MRMPFLQNLQKIFFGVCLICMPPPTEPKSVGGSVFPVPRLSRFETPVNGSDSGRPLARASVEETASACSHSGAFLCVHEFNARWGVKRFSSSRTVWKAAMGWKVILFFHSASPQVSRDADGGEGTPGLWGFWRVCARGGLGSCFLPVTWIQVTMEKSGVPTPSP